MDKMSFGEILRNTRERKGLDLNATARRLRIRPDILQAIEESNFAAMPPRGYARNMVNGYARYLGLNPTEITGMYLDELYAYQVEYETSRMRPTGIDMPSTQSETRAYRREAARASNRRTFYESEERASVRDQYSTAQGSSARRARSSSRDRLYPESRTHQARATVLPTNNYTNFYSGPGAIGFLQANWRYIVAALVALIVLGLIVSQIFSCSRKEEVEDVAAIPVSGVDAPENEVVTQPKAPTNFTFEYTVASGEVSWIEVYVNDAIEVGEAVEGPQTRSFTSSDSIQFITANPAPVTAKINGEVVELEQDADGVVNMTWNFSDILAQWLADHPGVKASDTADSSTSAGSSDSQDSAVGASGEGIEDPSSEGAVSDGSDAEDAQVALGAQATQDEAVVPEEQPEAEAA